MRPVLPVRDHRVSAHELSATTRRHVTVEKLNKAIADAVNAFMELDLIRMWGDGSVVAADGTQVDTFIDNLYALAHLFGFDHATSAQLEGPQLLPA